MKNSITKKVLLIASAFGTIFVVLLLSIFSVINNERVVRDPGVNANITTLSFTDKNSVRHELDLELATTPAEQTIGLMNRTTLDPGTGMLFIFDHPQMLTFWMKDTLVSLDIIFLDSNLRVINIQKYTIPNQTEQTYASTAPAQFVIETNAGWSDAVNLAKNDQFVREN